MEVNLVDDLRAFDAFVIAHLSGRGQLSLEEALQEYRSQQQWRPRTKLGECLKELRSQFIDEGGQLLNDAEVASELRERRGASLAE